MVELKLKLQTAKRYRDALTTVLEEADIHSDEAVILEVMRDNLDFKIEQFMDHMSDVEIH